MNIAGSGHISAGEYNEKITVSGSGKIDGNIRCLSFTCSGATSAAGDLICAEDARISGSTHVERNFSAKNMLVSGSFRVGGDCKVEQELKIAGSSDCRGDLKATRLNCAGKLKVGGGIEAEEVELAGVVDCAGLLNAEKIKIKFEGMSSRVGSIGGSDIKVYCDKKTRKITRLPLFSKLVGGEGILQIDESIEGDVIAIESVHTPLVIGRIVAIGADCHINLAQYSEEIEIHPDAKVERCEKV